MSIDEDLPDVLSMIDNMWDTIVSTKTNSAEVPTKNTTPVTVTINKLQFIEICLELISSQGPYYDHG